MEVSFSSHGDFTGQVPATSTKTKGQSNETSYVQKIAQVLDQTKVTTTLYFNIATHIQPPSEKSRGFTRSQTLLTLQMLHSRNPALAYSSPKSTGGQLSIQYLIFSTSSSSRGIF